MLQAEVKLLTNLYSAVLVWLREEVWKGHQESPQGQQEATEANNPWAVNSAAKVADKDDEDDVADLGWGGQREQNN